MQDFVEANNHYYKSAMKNNAAAQFALGDAYY
jgi:TPR repeat protein